MKELGDKLNINFQDIEESSLSQNNSIHSFESESRNDFMISSYLYAGNIINPLNSDSSMDMNQTEENEDIENENENNNVSNKKSIVFNVDHSPDNNSSPKNKNNNKNGNLGRKRRSDATKGEHNRFSDDNLRKKTKHVVLHYAEIFINEKIKEVYNGNIGIGMFKKQILTLNGDQKSNSSIAYNQQFLHKKLGAIFSDDISKRFTNYNKKHNKELIEELMNEKNEFIRDYFRKLFNITFMQLMKHFRGDEIIQELQGMKLLYQIKDELSSD